MRATVLNTHVNAHAVLTTDHRVIIITHHVQGEAFRFRVLPSTVPSAATINYIHQLCDYSTPSPKASKLHGAEHACTTATQAGHAHMPHTFCHVTSLSARSAHSHRACMQSASIRPVVGRATISTRATTHAISLLRAVGNSSDGTSRCNLISPPIHAGVRSD